MSGLMTSKQMQINRINGKSKSDFALIRANAAAGIEPAQDNDSPDATTLIKEAIKRGRGRPANSGNTEPVAIRFDKAVLEAFRATGKGWQTRINAVLLKHLDEANMV
jgi:uncharacterized protein (DUF4415 family)